ncbi:MAG: ATP-binding protein [Dehalococcoidia bacterium]|nr:ATP-binding protein [Dehalococcoidia bacterium]
MNDNGARQPPELTQSPTPVGQVLGTEDATPLEFWVALRAGQVLQLDDLVALQRVLPDGRVVRIFGVVTQVRTRHEGTRFDTDVFLIKDGVLPAEVSEAARILATRFEPEVFVPPWPGEDVFRAEGSDRDLALFADSWEEKVPIGLSRNGEPVYANLEFMDGRRGAHVNISGVSGVATKSTYALFLLFSLFESGALGAEAINTCGLVFNVKGEDLLFLDRPNNKLTPERAVRYQPLGLTARPFSDVTFWAPPRRGVASAAPDVSSRASDVTSFFWTVHEFCTQDLLPFLFADAEDERAQYPMVLHNVMAQLRKAEPYGYGAASLEYQGVAANIDTYERLVKHIESQLAEDPQTWAGPAIGQGTINAFVRRLYGSAQHVQHLIRGDILNPEEHRIRFDSRLSVIDIHNMNDRAQRFVVGSVLRKAFEDKERSGSGKPLLFVVLDELNKYAPRDGSSPIKEILLDIAERGRSLGIILIGAQQTASEVERRIVANSSLRVVGRLDSAEATREEYRFLPETVRQRATILKPGTMIVSQPELPVPVVLEFPFPAWATRQTESALVAASGPSDPFEGLV